MSQGYSGLPSYYVQSANPITPNLGLSLKGCDPIVAEDFVLIDTAFGSISASIEVNGVVVPAPANLINSATVVFSVSGSNISATASGGGGGGVSSFSAGNLIPLFTTSVATPTTTPALSFSLDTQAAGTVFAGPATGLNAAPTFRALVATDIPALPYLPSSTQLPQTIAATAHEWLNSYTSTTGLFTATQPNFTDIAGSIAIGQTPLTTAGDLLYANSTPALSRLGIGTTGQVLTVVGGLPAWTTIVSGVTSVFGRTGAVVATTGDYTVAQVTGAAPLASPTFTGTAAFSNITVSGTTSFAAGSIAYTALSGVPAGTWSGLTGTLSSGQVIPYADAGISRLGAASLAIGNGTAGDISGCITAAVGLNNQSSSTAAHTAILSDADQLVTMSDASASTFTVPPNSGVAFPVGTFLSVSQLGTGQITLTPGAGVTIHTPSSLTTRAQYSTVAVVQTAANVWLALGDLT